MRFNCRVVLRSLFLAALALGSSTVAATPIEMFPPLPGDVSARVTDSNGNGQSVGVSFDGKGTSAPRVDGPGRGAAVLWEGGVPRVINGGRPSIDDPDGCRGSSSIALAINNAGQVIGNAFGFSPPDCSIGSVAGFGPWAWWNGRDYAIDREPCFAGPDSLTSGRLSEGGLMSVDGFCVASPFDGYATFRVGGEIQSIVGSSSTGALVEFLSGSGDITSIVAYRQRDEGGWGRMSPSQCGVTIALSLDQLDGCVSAGLATRVPEPLTPSLVFAAALSLFTVSRVRKLVFTK